MYHSINPKLPSPDELHKRDKIKFWVRHIHDGNDPEGKERAEFTYTKVPPIYVTTCEITDWEEKEVLGWGESVCSHKDTPDRKKGHGVAVARAIKNYLEIKERKEKSVEANRN